MKVVETVADLKSALSAVRLQGKKVGLVPTMGALHQGHGSLVKKSVVDNDITVVSVFVNPTQFNDKNDLVKYPRTLEEDCQLLEKYGANLVFAPTVNEVYPEEDTRQFNFSPLDQVMEGKYRPGHFNGVGQVVSKLFAFISPDKAYFGEKDFQQLAIIRQMVEQLNLSVDIVGCPIIREKDGLALSSRNRLLSTEQRKQALSISRLLFSSVEYAKDHTLAETKQYVEQGIEHAEGLELEYFEISDATTLQPVSKWSQASKVVGCITAYCGKVRLIDNIKYKD